MSLLSIASAGRLDGCHNEKRPGAGRTGRDRLATRGHGMIAAVHPARAARVERDLRPSLLKIKPASVTSGLWVELRD